MLKLYNFIASRNILYLFSVHKLLRRLKKTLTFQLIRKCYSSRNTICILCRTEILHQDKKKKRLARRTTYIYHPSSLKKEKYQAGFFLFSTLESILILFNIIDIFFQETIQLIEICINCCIIILS